MEFLNNFKDFFTQFFSASFSFPEYIMYMIVPFIVGLAVKIFNKVRFASVDKGIHNKTTKYGLPTY